MASRAIEIEIKGQDLMAKHLGPTELDQHIVDWLERHHIRGKDVYAWSSAGKSGEMTVMTISFHVSGVDTLPDMGSRWASDIERTRLATSADTEQMTAVPPFPRLNPEAYSPDEPRPYLRPEAWTGDDSRA